MTADLGGGGVDLGVVRLQRRKRGFLHFTAKEQVLQLVELLGDVVLPVELAFVKYACKDVLGEDVLDQHFPYVGVGDGGVDGLLGVGEESARGLDKG